jgi:hypothetical protein
VTLLAEALTLFRDLGDTRGTVQTLEGVGEVACARGQFERAAHLFGLAEAEREAIAVPLLPAEHIRLDPVQALVREPTGTALATAWTVGRAMSLEQAIAYALEEPA